MFFELRKINRLRQFSRTNPSEIRAYLTISRERGPGPARKAEPDWASIHRELKRKHVTLSILWEGYIAQQSDGLRYSRFCELYRTSAAKLPVVMRQTHAAGEKLFLDYAGDTVPVIVNRLTGEWREALQEDRSPR